MKNLYFLIFIGIASSLCPSSALAVKQPIEKNLVYILVAGQEIGNIQLLEWNEVASTNEGKALLKWGLSPEELNKHWFYRFLLGQGYYFCIILKDQSIEDTKESYWIFEGLQHYVEGINLVNFSLARNPNEKDSWHIILPSNETLVYQTLNSVPLETTGRKRPADPQPLAVPAPKQPVLIHGSDLLRIQTPIIYPSKQTQPPKSPKFWPKWNCASCETNLTPERRAGPGGRNTLCNACGIKYNKAEKQRKQRIADEQASTRQKMSFDLLNHEDE